ncbi:MAG: peptidylprolyl isomerase [Nocardioides sp.]
MLKRLTAQLASAAALTTLAACGTATSSTGAPTSDTSAKDTQPPASTPASPSASTSTAASGACTYSPDAQGAAKKVNPPPSKPTVKGKVDVTMKTTLGDLHATLDAGKTPCTVNSFVSLAKQGFYDNTPCHRLTTAGIFVLQCGDPTGQGTGGPGYTVPDELSGKETYGPGTLAMANTGQPNSGGSQFFIVYKNTPLPPSYAVFGKVDKAGVKTVAKAAKKGTDNAFGQGDGHPKVKSVINSVTVG